MIELESEGKTPAYMELAKWKFMLSLPENYDNSILKGNLMTGILAGNMAPFYSTVCADLGWELNEELLARMQDINRLKFMEFDGDETTKSDDDGGVKLWQDKLEYLCSIGDKEASLKLATEKGEDSSLSINCRLDAIFTIFKIAYFHGCDLKLMKEAIEKATELIDGNTGVGGDWSARNKLKAYEAVCCLGHREYSKAANLSLDAVPTFESYELLDFVTLVRYTVLSCMVALTRCEMNNKLKKNGALIQALHSHYPEEKKRVSKNGINEKNGGHSALTPSLHDHYPDLRKFYNCLYDGQYKEFFCTLAKVERYMKNEKLLRPHYRHYVREMKLKAYSQLLQAYRSLSLKSMAEAFGVTKEYIENDVYRFAALGRLQCKIDSVAGRVIPNAFVSDGKCESKLSVSGPQATYERGIMYQVTIKHGDVLFNRLKNLARVMDF